MSHKSDLQSIISECCSEVLFTYNGKRAGVTSIVNNYIPLFQAWYGQDTKEYSTVDALMSDPFFDGKTLAELAEVVEFSYA